MTLKGDHHRPRFENDKVDIICIYIYFFSIFAHITHTTGFFGSYFFCNFAFLLRDDVSLKDEHRIHRRSLILGPNYSDLTPTSLVK